MFYDSRRNDPVWGSAWKNVDIFLRIQQTNKQNAISKHDHLERVIPQEDQVEILFYISPLI